MMKALSSFVVVILSLLPIVDGSSLLRYQDGSAYCQGNLTNLTFVSATCPDTEYGCTWGSTASLFVQVNATTEIPHQTKITVSPSLPHIPGSGTYSFYNHSGYISKVCGTHLSPPAGNDAGYSCPDAGMYNYRVNFTLLGNTSAWYGRYYGFNIGWSVHLYDASTGDSYATCYAEMKVKPGRDNPATDWAFLGGGGLASLVLAGYIYRKRRVTTMTTDSLDRCQESDDTTVTHFELVSDPICKV